MLLYQNAFGVTHMSSFACLLKLYRNPPPKLLAPWNQALEAGSRRVTIWGAILDGGIQQFPETSLGVLFGPM
jgi:hypothetical protein